MNPANKSRPDAPTPADNITDLDNAGGTRTPVSDMQPEDAGTPESGNTRGNAADDESEPGRKAGHEKANKR